MGTNNGRFFESMALLFEKHRGNFYRPHSKNRRKGVVSMPVKMP
jgi:hypothetical protein